MLEKRLHLGNVDQAWSLLSAEEKQNWPDRAVALNIEIR